MQKSARILLKYQQKSHGFTFYVYTWYIGLIHGPLRVAVDIISFGQTLRRKLYTMHFGLFYTRI